MLWVLALSLSVLLLAGGPLVAGFWYRRELEARRISYEHLVVTAGTCDRDELQSRFGPPDEEDCYTVSAEFAERCAQGDTLAYRLPESWWFETLNSYYMAYACLFAATFAIGIAIDNLSAALWIAGLAAFCQVVRWGVAVASIDQETFIAVWNSWDE